MSIKNKFVKIFYIFLNMSKNIGLFWLRDDFRLKRNLALAEATKNHDHVVAFYLLKRKKKNI